MFESYEIEKYSKEEKYKKGGIFDNHPEYRILCKNCGFSFGEHYGAGGCPSIQDIGHKPEFYPEIININIKIL